MKAERGKPIVEDSAKGLEVRPTDVPVKEGLVYPQTGGMSVQSHWRDLPAHRLPKRLSSEAQDAHGSNELVCFRLGEGLFKEGPVAPELALRLDTPTHGLVEPREITSIEAYKSALAATKNQWIIDED
jgi:hypothetical protein